MCLVPRDKKQLLISCQTFFALPLLVTYLLIILRCYAYSRLRNFERRWVLVTIGKIFEHAGIYFHSFHFGEQEESMRGYSLGRGCL